VRRASLLADASDVLLARRPWIEAKLKSLAKVFAIDIDTFSAMDNHLHLILTIRPEVANEWSKEEVARRWLILFEPSRRGQRRAPTAADVEALAKKSDIDKYRRRLYDLGEFHKAIKEPLAILVNREEGVTGHFWEGRFKTRRVLDRAAMLATMAYVDLNPVRSGAARTPEESRYAGIRHRAQARTQTLARLSRRERTRLRSEASRRTDWRRGCLKFATEPVPSFLTPIAQTTARRGVFTDITLDEYLVLVDQIGRRIRAGKRGHIPEGLAPILERLEIDPERFMAQVARTDKWFGSVIGLDPAVRSEAKRCCRTRVVSAMNLGRDAPRRPCETSVRTRSASPRP